MWPLRSHSITSLCKLYVPVILFSVPKSTVLFRLCTYYSEQFCPQFCHSIPTHISVWGLDLVVTSMKELPQSFQAPLVLHSQQSCDDHTVSYLLINLCFPSIRLVLLGLLSTKKELPFIIKYKAIERCLNLSRYFKSLRKMEWLYLCQKK